MTTFDLDGFLPYQLSVAASRVSRDFAALYKTRFGISVAEWRVVAHLSKAKAPLSVREIHARVDMDKSKVSRAAARLQAAGYLVKTDSRVDRRLVALELSAKGREMMNELAPLAEAFQQRLLARLGGRADGFLAGLETIANDATD